MSRRDIAFFSAVLLAMGAGWGLSTPLSKIAVSTGYGPFGLIFWQLMLGIVLMGGACVLRGTPLPLGRAAIRAYVAIALIGTVFPNTLSYSAAVHLPSGIMSLLLSIIPMFGFAIALALGNDTFARRRFVGLVFGLVGVLILISPTVDLGLPVPLGWAAVYLVVALFYAFEGNYVARWGVAGLDPFQLMLGASVVGVLCIAPPMILRGQFIAPVWPLPVAQAALIGSSVLHVVVYAAYVWLVGRAGAVFAVQVSYLVTGFGLFWAWLILDERLGPGAWIAACAMFAGIYLVQPRLRPRSALAPRAAIGDS
ncbi:DMT family transporter [Sulfitobacter albidus]|uniref:DMT family transporter n=1 Tax=Sulfitobacter albidus TaxID=2829501 RepID=A0A975PMQ1_9RHOB|nr:DMT family transporter [Sulfitobacter albidus]QUJ77043.1 DMT family transporter [Sulfitobacter albidus]